MTTILTLTLRDCCGVLRNNSKWGGRGMGGRATGRVTVQTRDVVVEGLTLAYLGMNLLGTRM